MSVFTLGSVRSEVEDVAHFVDKQEVNVTDFIEGQKIHCVFKK